MCINIEKNIYITFTLIYTGENESNAFIQHSKKYKPIYNHKKDLIYGDYNNIYNVNSSVCGDKKSKT